MTDVEIHFAAKSGGTGPLTWGQRAIWQAMAWLGDESHYFNLGHVFVVPPQRSERDVHDAVQTMIELHEGLRTRFPGYPSEPSQEVHASGVFLLVRHAVGADDDVEMAAEALKEELRGRAFRHEAEWPLRMALVSRDDRPCRLVLALSHQVMDGGAWQVLRARFESALAGAAPDADDATWGPLTLAEFERSESGARRSDFAIRRWRKDLATVSPSIFDYPMCTFEGPRYRGLTMRSPALAVAAQVLADAMESTTSTVLLAATAAVLAHYTGHHDLTMQLIVANRSRPEVRDAFAPMAENGLLAVPLAGLDFDQAVTASWHSAFTCFRAAQYDPVAFAEMLRSVQVERGVYVDREAFFNDVRPQDRWPEVPVTDGTEAGLRRLRDATTVEETDSWERLGLKAFFHLRYAPDHAVVHLQADLAYLPLAAAEGLLYGIETLVVTAVHRPVRLAEVGELIGVAPASRDEDWVRVGAGWVRPRAVAELLAACPGVARAAVFATPEVVGYVVPNDPKLTVGQLHEQACAALVAQQRTDAVTPAHYVLCDSAPADPDRLDGWRERPVLAEGSGRYE